MLSSRPWVVAERVNEIPCHALDLFSAKNAPPSERVSTAILADLAPPDLGKLYCNQGQGIMMEIHQAPIADCLSKPIQTRCQELNGGIARTSKASDSRVWGVLIAMRWERASTMAQYCGN